MSTARTPAEQIADCFSRLAEFSAAQANWMLDAVRQYYALDPDQVDDDELLEAISDESAGVLSDSFMCYYFLAYLPPDDNSDTLAERFLALSDDLDPGVRDTIERATQVGPSVLQFRSIDSDGTLVLHDVLRETDVRAQASNFPELPRYAALLGWFLDMPDAGLCPMALDDVISPALIGRFREHLGQMQRELDRRAREEGVPGMSMDEFLQVHAEVPFWEMQEINILKNERLEQFAEQMCCTRMEYRVLEPDSVEVFVTGLRPVGKGRYSLELPFDEYMQRSDVVFAWDLGAESLRAETLTDKDAEQLRQMLENQLGSALEHEHTISDLDQEELQIIQPDQMRVAPADLPGEHLREIPTGPVAEFNGMDLVSACADDEHASRARNVLEAILYTNDLARMRELEHQPLPELQAAIDAELERVGAPPLGAVV